MCGKGTKAFINQDPCEGERPYLPPVVSAVHAGISQLFFIQLFQIMHDIVIWWHKAKVCTADAATVYSIAGKQPASTQKITTKKQELNKNFQGYPR